MPARSSALPPAPLMPLWNLPAIGQPFAGRPGPMQRAAKDQVSPWR